MNTNGTSTQAKCSEQEIDEAAVWLAQLRSPQRTPRIDSGLRRWLIEQPSHAAAFDIVSKAWDLTGALKQPDLHRHAHHRTALNPRNLWLSVTAAAAIAVFVVGTAWHFHTRGVTTDVGEQRTLMLEDGTLVHLNTASRIVVAFNEQQRRVELKSGEALFDVARQARWPFVVVAGTRQVNALGTSFVVREDAGSLSVTLIEGKVAIAPQSRGNAEAGVSQHETDGRSEQLRSQGAVMSPTEVVLLAPGERLTLTNDLAAYIDRPRIEQVTAWRLGQVEFEDVALTTAADEMNRYSQLKLRIETPEIAQIRINGVFRTGDTVGFATAVARTYKLKMERDRRQIVLTGAPVVDSPAGGALL